MPHIIIEGRKINFALIYIVILLKQWKEMIIIL